MTEVDSAWWVYVLKSERTGVLYTGITTEFERRLRQHNGVIAGGPHTTTRGRPWALFHMEGPMSRSEALRREFDIKSWPRKKKLRLAAEGLRP